jgi:putative acetyltransferase
MIEETHAVVAVDGAVVAGFASVALEARGGLQRGEVDQLFVHPDSGGRGAARLLLTAVEDAARAAGIPELVTHASWRAAPVFHRLGYRQVQTETVRVDDQELTRALMRKLLPPAGAPAG